MDDRTAEMYGSAEFREVRDFVAGGHTLSDGNAAPFEQMAFQRFCNVMISAHWDDIVRRADGITVTAEGVEVRTQKDEAGKMVCTAAPAPAITTLDI